VVRTFQGRRSMAVVKYNERRLNGSTARGLGRPR
jgi:hypothetical protein